MKTLVMTCGNVGTGKSTTLRYVLMDYKTGTFVKFAVDDIALVVNGGRYEKEIWTDKHRSFYDLLKANIFAFGTHNNLHIILDDVYMSKADRELWLIEAKAQGYNSILFVHTHDRAIERRMNGDNRGYVKEQWEKIYNGFQSQWEEPTYEEGWDRIVRIHNDIQI